MLLYVQQVKAVVYKILDLSYCPAVAHDEVCSHLWLNASVPRIACSSCLAKGVLTESVATALPAKVTGNRCVVARQSRRRLTFEG